MARLSVAGLPAAVIFLIISVPSSSINKSSYELSFIVIIFNQLGGLQAALLGTR